MPSNKMQTRIYLVIVRFLLIIGASSCVKETKIELPQLLPVTQILPTIKSGFYTNKDCNRLLMPVHAIV